MEFHESPRFPEDVSFGFAGGPTYRTLIGEVLSGEEQRDGLWQNGRMEYDAAHGVKTAAQLKTLFIFFRNRKGRRIGFRVKDWLDFTFDVTEGVLGTGSGAGVPTYQIGKKYTDDGGTEIRIIQKPVDPCQFYRDAAPLAIDINPGDISVDYTKGLVTFVADDASSASSITPGAATQVVLASDMGFSVGQLLYLTGFTGADADLVNDLAHEITNITGAGPFTFTLNTNTNGKTITLGTGEGRRYPQADEALTCEGEFDVPCRFDTDKMLARAEDYNTYSWNQIPLKEVRV